MPGPSLHLSARPSARPSVRPSVRPSARPSVRPPVRPPVRPSVHLSVCLSVLGPSSVRFPVRPRPPFRLPLDLALNPVLESIHPAACPRGPGWAVNQVWIEANRLPLGAATEYLTTAYRNQLPLDLFSTFYYR